MHGSVRAVLLLVCLFYIVPGLRGQGYNASASSFTDLVTNAIDGVLNVSVSFNLTTTPGNISSNYSLSGRNGVWMLMPRESGVVQLKNGSMLEITNMGIRFSTGSVDAPDISALLQLPFFDVQPPSLLRLRDVVMDIDCGTLERIRDALCDQMPDFNYELMSSRIQVVMHSAPGLLAERVAVRCGQDATNATWPVFLNMSTAAVASANASFSIKCASSLVSTSLSLLRAVASYYFPGAPGAHYVMVVANITAEVIQYSLALVSKSTVIAGRQGVPTQIDLGFRSNIFKWPAEDADAYSVTFRDISVAGLLYGSSSSYPMTLVTAGMWAFDYSKKDSLFVEDVVARMKLYNTTVIVDPSELRWWVAMATRAIQNGETSIDKFVLVDNFPKGAVTVAADNSSVRVGSWSMFDGVVVWSDCVISSTLVWKVGGNQVPMNILDLLIPHGQTGPVPLSAIKFTGTTATNAIFRNESTVMLRGNTALQTSTFTNTTTTLGYNLTVLGDVQAPSQRTLALQSLPGVVAVPPYTILRLSYMSVMNLPTGLRDVQPPYLRNFTLFFWAFNRTLIPLDDSTGPSPDPGSQGRRSTIEDSCDRRLRAQRRRRLAQQADDGSSSIDSISSSELARKAYRPWLQLKGVMMYLSAVEMQFMYEIFNSNRTTLRVPAEAVAFYQALLSTVQVTENSPTIMRIKSMAFMGIEAVDIGFAGFQNSATAVIAPQGTFVLPEPPPPPPPWSLPPPPLIISSPVPPPPFMSPSLPPANPNDTTAGPGTDVVEGPARGVQIGTVIGPAVGSAAGLITVGLLVAFVFVYVQRRRRKLQNPGGKQSDKEAGGTEGQATAVQSSSNARCRPNKGGGGGGEPTTGAEGAAEARGVEAEAVGATADDDDGEIQAYINSAGLDAAPAAAAAAAAGGRSHSSRRRSRVQNHRARGSGETGSGGSSGSSRRVRGGGSGSGSAGSVVRKSRSSGASAATSGSAGKSSSASASRTSGLTSSDNASNPRTELYAALAAFQSELGEQQQQISITCQLGAGAHGVVYKGEWRGLEVAVKTLLFQAFVGVNQEESSNSFKEQAMLEAAIATTLFHPNVINTFSYDIKPLRMCPAPAPRDAMVSTEGGGIMDWKLYIIQEYCDGGTLKDALDGARFNDPETGMAHTEIAVRVAIEIASGMSYIHARNIIHGDLKPANILLRSNTSSAYGYTAKIADFGLALKLKAGESHISNIRRGTPFYIAAELVEDGRATTASDLYSFGVILWELLHGCTVARRLPLRRRIPNLPAEFYTWPPECPATYRELATACLSPNPTNRPRFIEALGKLNKLLNALLEVKKEQQQRRQEEKKRRAAATAAAAAAAGMAGPSSSVAGGAAASGGEYLDKENGEEGGADAAKSSSGLAWAPPMLLGGALGLLGGVPLLKPIGSSRPGAGGARGNEAARGGGGGGSKGAGGSRVDAAAAEDPASCRSPACESQARANGTGTGQPPAQKGADAATAATTAHHEAMALARRGLLLPMPNGTGGPLDGGAAKEGSEEAWAAVRAAAAAAAATPAPVPPGPSSSLAYAALGGAVPMVVRGLGRATTADVAVAIGTGAAAGAPPGGNAVLGAVGNGDGGGGRAGDDGRTVSAKQFGVPFEASSVAAAVAVSPMEAAVPPNPHTPPPSLPPASVGHGAAAGHREQQSGAGTNRADGCSSLQPVAISAAAVGASAASASDARGGGGAAAGGMTAVPQSTASVAAAALAALAASRTTTVQSIGVLDSCLGMSSLDCRAMERGLMLDLMPALSNQGQSGHFSSSLRPDLAAALENALGAHGLHQNPGLMGQGAGGGGGGGMGSAIGLGVGAGGRSGEDDGGMGMAGSRGVLAGPKAVRPDGSFLRFHLSPPMDAGLSGDVGGDGTAAGVAGGGGEGGVGSGTGR